MRVLVEAEVEGQQHLQILHKREHIKCQVLHEHNVSMSQYQGE